jgi:hypothetical protein
MTSPISSPSVAPPLVLGSAEDAIAEVGIRLEESHARLDEAARETRRERRAQRRAQLEEEEHASRVRLGTGLIRPLAQGVIACAAGRGRGEALVEGGSGEGLAGFARRQQALGGSIDGALRGAEALGGFYTERADRAAARHEHLAEDLGEEAQHLRAEGERSENLAGRALGHLDELSRARWQARLDLARG